MHERCLLSQRTSIILILIGICLIIYAVSSVIFIGQDPAEGLNLALSSNPIDLIVALIGALLIAIGLVGYSKADRHY